MALGEGENATALIDIAQEDDINIFDLLPNLQIAIFALPS